jgi:hypothetical protein
MAGQQQKMSPMMLVALLVSMGLSFYMMFAYEGPFRWTAELQLKIFGVYYEKVAFVVTFMLVYGAIMLAAKPLEGLLRREGGGRWGEAPAGILFTVMGLAVIGIGLWKVHRARHAGALTPVDAEVFDSGKAPPSLWVRVRGYAVNQAAVTFEHSHSTEKFIPIVSGSGTAREHGVRLFLKVKADVAAAQPDEERGEYEGMLFPNDLPGALRVALQRDGVLKGSDYYVLELGKTPEDQVLMGKTLAGIRGVCAAIGVVVALVLCVRGKREDAGGGLAAA